MLFMDETINNLDQDTVGKVAEMLGNFVKQRNVKLYTVTHSQQIQEMDIWDDVVEL
jgi:ABC-type lipoprotein export system ATPase subunit